MRSIKQHKGYCLLVILSLLLLLSIHSYADKQSKNVLILQSYHNGHPWSDQEGLSAYNTLLTSRIDLMVYWEHMDWKRFPSQENISQLHERFLYKYANKKIDLIITSDDAALKFALDYRHEIFSQAPIVFMGVLKENADLLLKGEKNVTGIYEGKDPEGTIRIAQKLLPGLKNVYVIHDLSESGVSTGELIKTSSQFTSHELNFYDISTFDFDKISNTVSQLPNDSIVLLASYNYDSNNFFMANTELAKLISSASAVPVFTIDEALLGVGCVGGNLISGKMHGEMAANQGVKVLLGQSADSLSIIYEKSVFWGFDYNVLIKYNLDPKDLPKNSQIINKPFSFFATYKRIVFGALILFTLLICFIIILLFYLRYRKRIESVLKEQKEKIFDLAYFNSVTKLPNKIKLQEIMRSHIQDSGNQSFTLIYLDIDDFKEINDSFGHSVGDSLLYEVANRLSKLVSEYCMIFNQGGDEFIILINKQMGHEEIEDHLDKLFRYFGEPILLDQNSFFLSVSGGVVSYPEHGDSYHELLKNADTAMYHSKSVGKCTYTFYNDAIGNAAVERTKIQAALRNALDKNEFVLYYQPQFDKTCNRILGFEALVRWNSAENGIVLPNKFIKIAEESRLIIPIGSLVLKTACKTAKELQETYNRDYIISVNISVQQLKQNEFVNIVFNILEETNLKPELLELEITESVFINLDSNIIYKLELLKSKGINIAIDDFGTGYSSLSYLCNLPISTLKIDKGFIDCIKESQRKSILLGSIIEMGHSLGLQVVAEGVEHNYQKDYLLKQKCDRYQGFLFSKPLPLEHLQNLLGEFN